MVTQQLLLAATEQHNIRFIDVREGVGDRNNRSEFMQYISRKYFITKQDVRNIRSKAKDPLIMRHIHDPTSVSANNKCILYNNNYYSTHHVNYMQQQCLYISYVHKGGSLRSRATAGSIQLNIDVQGTGRTGPQLSFVVHLYWHFRRNFNWIYTKNMLLQCYAYNFKLITCIVADEAGQGTLQALPEFMGSLNMHYTYMFVHVHVQDSLWVGAFQTEKIQR